MRRWGRHQLLRQTTDCPLSRPDAIWILSFWTTPTSTERQRSVAFWRPHVGPARRIGQHATFGHDDRIDGGRQHDFRLRRHVDPAARRLRLQRDHDRKRREARTCPRRRRWRRTHDGGQRCVASESSRTRAAWPACSRLASAAVALAYSADSRASPSVIRMVPPDADWLDARHAAADFDRAAQDERLERRANGRVQQLRARLIDGRLRLRDPRLAALDTALRALDCTVRRAVFELALFELIVRQQALLEQLLLRSRFFAASRARPRRDRAWSPRPAARPGAGSPRPDRARTARAWSRAGPAPGRPRRDRLPSPPRIRRCLMPRREDRW